MTHPRRKIENTLPDSLTFQVTTYNSENCCRGVLNQPCRVIQNVRDQTIKIFFCQFSFQCLSHGRKDLFPNMLI